MVIRYLIRIVISPILLFNFIIGGQNVISVDDSLFAAKIERDDWGVPHIYGTRDADVSFGLAYAHAQDDFTTLEDIVFALRGELASKPGRSAAVNDYYVHLMN